MPVEAGYKQGSGIRESAACSNHGLYSNGACDGTGARLLSDESVVRFHPLELRRILVANLFTGYIRHNLVTTV